MELVTALSPAVFNAVKFIILYALVDHVLPWATRKLKRAVNVADLKDGNPVSLRSVTGRGGRSTVKKIFADFIAMFSTFSSSSPVIEEDDETAQQHRQEVTSSGQLTRSGCVSAFNKSSTERPITVRWNTTLERGSNSTARLKHINSVRKDLSISGFLTWERHPSSPELHYYCYRNGSKRFIVLACIHERTYRIANREMNDVFMAVVQKSSISFIHVSVPAAPGNSPLGLSGILDGPVYMKLFPPTVFETDDEVFLSRARGLLAAVVGVPMFHNLFVWQAFQTEQSAAHMVKIFTTFAGLGGNGTGTWRTCEATVLSLNTIGVISALVLVFSLLLILAMSAVTTPEKLLALYGNGRALDSYEWAVLAFLYEKLGPDSLVRKPKVRIRENGEELSVTISTTDGPTRPCSPSEIPDVQGLVLVE